MYIICTLVYIYIYIYIYIYTHRYWALGIGAQGCLFEPETKWGDLNWITKWVKKHIYLQSWEKQQPSFGNLYSSNSKFIKILWNSENTLIRYTHERWLQTSSLLYLPSCRASCPLALYNVVWSYKWSLSIYFISTSRDTWRTSSWNMAEGRQERKALFLWQLDLDIAIEARFYINLWVWV